MSRKLGFVFPGQGSQKIGMGKDFFENYDLVKDLFKEADESLGISLSKIILEGPKDKLDLTINTQPAIFLISYSIFQVMKKEFNIDLDNAKYFAGHSLGEYSALCAAKYLSFSDTIKILKTRGNAMQNAVPKGEGGMLAVLGSKVEIIEDLLSENKNNFIAQIANDNSEGQIVLSGRNSDIEKLIKVFKSKNIKNIKLPVSAPFHCQLMSNATEIMRNEIQKLNLQKLKNISIIYRNYERKSYEKNAFEIQKICKMKGFKFFIANNYKFAIKIGANGIYIPSFNKKMYTISNSKIDIIGSAHSSIEINRKIEQGCKKIFLSKISNSKINKSILVNNNNLFFSDFNGNIGVFSLTYLLYFLSAKYFLVRGVKTMLGQTLLTLILYFARSKAIPFVKPSTPNFVIL